MRSKFNIEFKSCQYGWMRIILTNFRKGFMLIDASYVYSPFWDYLELLENIKKNKRKTLTLEIDQEGITAYLTIKIVNNRIVLTTETDVDKDSHRFSKHYRKITTVYNKKVFMKRMKNSLLKFSVKNKKCINDRLIFKDDDVEMDFYLNVKRLKRI